MNCSLNDVYVMCLLLLRNEDEQNLKVVPLNFISYGDPTRIERTGTRPDRNVHANLFMYASDHNSICIYINGKWWDVCRCQYENNNNNTRQLLFGIRIDDAEEFVKVFFSTT